MNLKFIFIVLLVFFSACKSQKQHSVSLRITNRSSLPIDSVFFSHNNVSITKKIDTGETRTIEADISAVNLQAEGMLNLFLFQQGRKTTVDWGLHDRGAISHSRDNIYLFDNGINFKDQAPLEPVEFLLFIIDKTSKKIDSVTAPGKLPRPVQIRDRFFELKLDFRAFREDPFIKVYQQNENFVIPVDHDWKDWNNKQEFLYVYDNGIVSKIEKK